MIEITNKKPKDRLECTEAIYKCNIAIGASIEGWSQWLQNPGIMGKFTEDELNEIHNEFKKLSLLFLSYDIKWTKKLTNKFKIKDTDDLSQIFDEGCECGHNKDDDNDNSYIR